jgi:hypothetical protein
VNLKRFLYAAGYAILVVSLVGLFVLCLVTPRQCVVDGDSAYCGGE